jgi:hypothetical protein
MKLLLDQNISFRITNKIQDLFPGSKQVRDLGLENSKDSFSGLMLKKIITVL